MTPAPPRLSAGLSLPVIFVSFGFSHRSLTVFGVRADLSTCRVNAIPKYFIVFHAVVNGTVFFGSCSDDLLLVYRNTTDFCMLTLHLAVLLNLLVSSSRFLVKSVGSPIHKLTSRANEDDFTSSFPTWTLSSLPDCSGWDIWYKADQGALVLFLI